MRRGFVATTGEAIRWEPEAYALRAPKR